MLFVHLYLENSIFEKTWKHNFSFDILEKILSCNFKIFFPNFNIFLIFLLHTSPRAIRSQGMLFVHLYLENNIFEKTWKHNFSLDILEIFKNILKNVMRTFLLRLCYNHQIMVAYIWGCYKMIGDAIMICRSPK
jgi:hypothetical protein